MIMAVSRRRDIGAAFWIERRFDFDDLGAKPARHIFDHVIASDPQRPFGHFRRQMTIAEVPGDANERARIRATDFREPFRRGEDFDDASVLELKPVAGAQHRRFGQIEKKGEAADPGHRDAPSMALVIVEYDGIGRGAFP